MRRRSFVATAAGLGSALLAGCSGGGSGGGGSDDGTAGGGGSGGGGSTDGNGFFRLLISDQPAAIGDFDSLDVTLSSARVFRADEDEEVTSAAVTETETERTDSNATETTTTEMTTTPESPAATATETTAEETEDGSEGEGFVELELDGVTVDLTQVVGDRAVSVLEDELEAGRYSGIELLVDSAEGVVDGETVDVTVPSNRLRIIRPFEVAAEEELSFVFDINVVQKGPNGGYNLLPVIGKSGVVGEDVEVEEVDPGEDGDAAEDDDTAEEDTETTEPTESTNTADGDASGDEQPDDADN